jgi:predicted N-formylglutamate amidohydrolase
MSFDPVFQTHGTFGEAPIFFFCDHATPRIPDEFHNLGLDARFLQTHIAYDIGAKDLTLALADHFGARAITSDFSRMLVDPNRSMDRDDHIPAVSDGIEIPGNQGLTAVAREERIHRFFEPYHQALAEEIDAARGALSDPLLVSVHSFTPRLHTTHEDRPWHVGILWAHDEPTAKRFITALRERAPDYRVGDNEPYDARGFNYTIDRHIKPLGLRHLTLEVRQDLIADAQGIAAMSRLLAGAIGDLMERETA